MTRLWIHSAWIFTSFAKKCCFSTQVLPSCLLSPTRTTYSRHFSAFGCRSISHVLPSPHNATKSASQRLDRHTVAQIARAASQAIRVATREENLRDAFHIANSVLRSPLEPWVVSPQASRSLHNPMNFGRPVPTRLVTHTLIHALLREGYAFEAGRQMERLVAIGVRFHYKTIEASVALLCSKPSRVMNAVRSSQQFTLSSRGMSKNDWLACRVLRKKKASLIPETRLALDLLSAARESRRRRTERMYDWVIDACLLQGEIFTATLLFVVLVKDWQLRKALKRPSAESNQDTGNMDAIPTKPILLDPTSHRLRQTLLAKEIGLDDHNLRIPYPEGRIMQSILDSIQHRLFSVDPRVLSKLARVDCEKSLAYLANLIEQQCLPSGRISPLIRALYSCPRSQTVTHILEDGRKFHVNVYEYSHKVLLHLCQRLPSQRLIPSLSHPEVLPPLDTRAYNSLLYYALRHRLSPALADAVIEHMTVHRKPPLQPNITTYNILLHSASTLRLPGLADHILNTLHLRHGNCPTLPSLTHGLSPCATQPEKRGGSLIRLAEQVTYPAVQPSVDNIICYARLRPINVDAYTLSIYITHLTRTGRPEIIADIIFDLIPELEAVDHPATSPSARGREEAQDEPHVKQLENIRRAAVYGPYFFSVLLNALQKANKVGLAERVWLLARQAEKASWMQPNNTNVYAPWCLPIEAYTSMIQCYANESKKGAQLVRGSRSSRPLSATLSLSQERQVWEPRNPDKMRVKGWAQFYLRMQVHNEGCRIDSPLRWKTAREVGYLLLQTMRKGALSVLQELIAFHPENAQQLSPQWATVLRSLKLPVGDARFFNSVLDIFGRRVNIQARRVRPSPSWWARKLRIAQKVYRETGWTSMVYDHTLVEIARDMARAGYELPLGLQRALVGRMSFSVLPVKREDLEVRPFAFPRPRNLRSRMFSLRVTKSRGLPLGRRKPEIMRSSHIEARKRAKDAKKPDCNSGGNIVQ